jgi:hypothetical protein|tara:strand:+ start:7985 stop:9283 length:1299 start_codon:yes stop_codon:yes gene_type:complete
MYSNEQLNAIHSSKIGFEFEFFSNENLDLTKDSLSQALNKKIRIEEKAHSDFTPTEETFKLEPDNSGGTGMIELVTGPLPFVEAKLVMAKALKWIRENGSTNERCSIHINLAFDGKKLGPITNMSNLDIGKFVLNFDENKVYEAFPNRRDSVYAKSIKFIVPLSGMTQPSPEKNLWKNYMFVKEKYYGINFSKVPKGYIEFRYLGGKDYENRYSTILSLTEHFITSLYETLVNPQYSESDLKVLDKILEKHKTVIESYRTYSSFKEKFPNIHLMIDLKTADQIVEMYYPKIREKIFDLITKADMNEGFINYDADTGRIQIKDAKLMRCFEINGIDIVDSIIQGNIVNCDIFSCDLKNSSIFESNLFGATVAEDSKIEESYVSRNVICEDSYVFGKRGVFSGEMVGGIFRQGRATKLARFGDNTEVIEIEKIK